jgi:uncharacterized protein YjeT (DUF2065 family)
MASPKRLTPSEVEMDLDEQIALAEMAVVARDRRIRHRTDVLVARVKRDALRHAGGGLLMGVGTVALTWWLNRLSKRHSPPPAGAAAGTPPPQAPPTFEHLFRDAGLTLAGLLPVLWPMLPRAWRRLVTPGTAGTLLTFMAPLLGRLFRRKGRRTESA